MDSTTTIDSIVDTEGEIVSYPTNSAKLEVTGEFVEVGCSIEVVANGGLVVA